MARTAAERSNLYGFLAMMFRQEVTANVLRQLKEPRFLAALSEAGAELDRDFLQRPEHELLEELAVEYTGLFIGPGRHVSPHASVHLEGEGGALWGRSTSEVMNFIEAAGFEYRLDYHGLPDHISVGLEFMERLTKAEAEAWKKGHHDDASRVLEIEQAFLDRYISTWISSFCSRIVDMARLPFYREMAKLTADFIHSEQDEITKRKGEAGKSRRS